MTHGICKRSIHVLIAVLSVASFAGCEPVENANLVTEAATEAIRNLIEAERQANLAGDVEAFMALRTPDFTAMPPGMPPIHGTEDVREFISQSVQGGSVTDLQFETEDIRIDGDLGVAYVKGQGSMLLPDGAEMNARLSFLFVARRGADDAWSWIYCAWNVLPVV